MYKVSDYWEKINGKELAEKDLRYAKLLKKRRENEEIQKRNVLMERNGVQTKRYVTLNGEIAADWVHESAKHIARLRESRSALAKSAKDKKQRIDDHNLTMNILRLSKWDFVRKNNQTLRQENEEYRQQISRASWWAR